MYSYRNTFRGRGSGVYPLSALATCQFREQSHSARKRPECSRIVALLVPEAASSLFGLE